MKKNLFGMLAIVCAIGFVAFTTPKSTFSDVFFQYNSASFAEVDVENPANWIEVTDLTTGCDNVNNKACRLKVDHTNTDGTAPSRTLKSSVSINSVLYSPESSRFITSGGAILQVRNKD